MAPECLDPQTPLTPGAGSIAHRVYHGAKKTHTDPVFPRRFPVTQKDSDSPGLRPSSW